MYSIKALKSYLKREAKANAKQMKCDYKKELKENKKNEYILKQDNKGMLI